MRHSQKYDRAIAINADVAEAHFRRGNLLQKPKQLDAVLSSYDPAIEFNLDHAEVHANRGNGMAQMQRFDGALATYDQANALKSDCAEAYAAMSMLLLLRGNF